MMFFSFAVVFVVAALQFHTDSATGIRIDEDTVLCPPDSEYGWFDTCEKRCDQLPPKHCPDVKPQWGCRCDEGYLAQSGTFGRNIECVPPEECKVDCGDNGYYDPLGDPCLPTCGQPNRPELCKGIPGPRCVCNTGYIMDENQCKCVKPKECSFKAIYKP